MTKDAYEIFKFQKVGGGSRSLRIDRDKARDPTQVCSLLIKKNADLPYDQEEARNAVEKALKSEPSKRIRYAARLGWRADRRRFVTPRGTIGARQKVELRPPLWLNDRQHVEIGRQGTREEWIKRVAGPADIQTLRCLPCLWPLQHLSLNVSVSSPSGSTSLESQRSGRRPSSLPPRL